VDENTIFQIGSTSKAFTGALVAMLMDEKKLGWQDRVLDRLEEFQMSDPWVTREFRVEDLMAQHSGLPAHAGDSQAFIGFDRAHIIPPCAISNRQPASAPGTPIKTGLFLMAAPW
jgi:CubicO group peptidase (beta-lactamase class C family)